MSILIVNCIIGFIDQLAWTTKFRTWGIIRLLLLVSMGKIYKILFVLIILGEYNKSSYPSILGADNVSQNIHAKGLNMKQIHILFNIHQLS